MLVWRWGYFPKERKENRGGQQIVSPVSLSSSKPKDVRNAEGREHDNRGPVQVAMADAGSLFSGSAAGFRVSNTPDGIDRLLRNPAAILLENAFLDTGRPLDVPIPDYLRSQGDPGAYVVQFRGALNARSREILTRVGGTFVSYIPNNAALVELPPEAAQRLALDPGVRAVLPYEPYYKLKASLLERVVRAQNDPSADTELLVRALLFPDARDRTRAALAESDIPVVAEQSSPLGEVLEMRTPAGKAAAIAALPGVQELELAHRPLPASDLSRVALGVASNPAAATQYLGLTGSNVVVNVNDTGVDATHPALAGRVLAGQSAALADSNGHGTHIAGLIAGNGAGSTTVTQAPGSPLPAVPGQFRGLAPGATVFSIALATNVPGPLEEAALFESAARTNAVISNNSWGYDQDNDYGLGAAICDAATRDAVPSVSGMQPLLCVFAAGNSGAGADNGIGGRAGSIQSPATAKNVITVGALEHPRFLTNQTWTCGDSGCATNMPWLGLTDSGTEVAAFSSRGNVAQGTEGEFGRFKPDVVAPGVFVLSTRSSQMDPAAACNPTNVWLTPAPDTNYCEVLSNLNASAGPLYRFESGTSVAAAEVSGALALIEEFFQIRLRVNPSPALLKALLINGARPVGTYDYALRSSTNAQGWGVVQVPNSIPGSLTNGGAGPNAMFFVDQDAARALATGDSQTFFVSVEEEARTSPLRITLAWSDPPGNPVAAVKLVNDLDLIVTNLQTGEVFTGNHFAAGARFCSAASADAPDNDSINNLENVFLAPSTGTNFSVTVFGRAVNVNVVSSGSGVAQDYALVIASGDGQDPDALAVSTNPPVPATFSVAATILTNQFTSCSNDFGVLLLNERVGAGSPQSAGGSVPLNGALDAAISLGDPNQWHFYVFANETDFTNLIFATFLSPVLTADGAWGSPSNPPGATAEADIDLYVSTDPGLTNLDPWAISAADKSLGRGCAETIFYTNAFPAVYYVGVKCESEQAAQYNFFAAASQEPLSQTDDSGNQILRGIPAPALIPGGGQTEEIFFSPEDFLVHRVIVTNTIEHPDLRDLRATLCHGNASADLLNHSGSTAGEMVFDDSGEGDIPGARPSDGPNLLTRFAGKQGGGLWLLHLSSTNQPGTNDSAWLFLQQQEELTLGNGLELMPGICHQDYLVTAPSSTNLQGVFFMAGGAGPVTVQLFPENVSPEQTPVLTLTPTAARGVLAIDKTSIPPLSCGTYVLRICNAGPDAASVTFSLSVLGDAGPPVFERFSSGAPMSLADDALSTSSILVTNEGVVNGLNVGVRIAHPRVSDLRLRLRSPSGSSVLLQDGRGGASVEGMGTITTETNMTTVSWSGGSAPFTNILETGETAGTIQVVYDFYSLPDQMTIYYDHSLLFDSGMVTDALVTNLSYGPGDSTSVSIVMNQFGNQDTNTAWYYRVSSTHTVGVPVTFSEDTNLASVPIKFAVPPFTNVNVSLPGGSPASGIFYLPEESLNQFRGEPAAGLWTLEIEDTRAGVTNPPPVLLGWRLDMNFRNRVPAPIALSPAAASTNLLAAGQMQWFAVDVPAWASFATNRLLFSSPAVNLLFNPEEPPTGTNALDRVLLRNSQGGAVVLSTNTPSAISPGGRYFLGVQNTNKTTVSFSLATDFDVTTVITLQSGLPYTTTSGRPADYYRFVVSQSGARAQFELNGPSTDLTLVASKGLPLPNATRFDYASANPGTNDELIVVLPSSSPAPLSPGEWFLGVLNPWGTPASYSILTTEFASAGTNLSITEQVYTNDSLCLSWGSLPGAYYVVEGSTNISPPEWFAISPPLRASDFFSSFCVPLPSAFHFFRVREGLAPSATPLVIQSIAAEPGGIRLRWSASAGSVFNVEWSLSASGSAWSTVTNGVTSSGSIFEFLDDGTQTGGPGQTRFYRLVQVQ